MGKFPQGNYPAQREGRRGTHGQAEFQLSLTLFSFLVSAETALKTIHTYNASAVNGGTRLTALPN